MNKKVIGIIMAVFGLVLAGTAYVFRPPSNFSEVMMMAARGQEFALNQPAYIAGLIGGVLLVAMGVWLISKANQ